jgi:hypothetical protein
MKPPTKSKLQKLDLPDQVRVILHLVWLLLRRPALPRPVHFALVACLIMFALLPVMPFHPLAIPTVIGGGISFALIMQSKGVSHEFHP